MSGPELTNIPRIYTALAEWLACLVYMAPFHKRFRGGWTAVAAVLFLLVQGAFLQLTDNVPIAWWIPCMAAAVGLMFSFIYTCCDLPALDAGYCCVRAFLLAEFAAALEWQLYYFAAQLGGTNAGWFCTLFVCVVYLTVFALMHLIESHTRAGSRLLHVSGREFAAAAVIGISAFLMSNLSYVFTNTPFSSSYRMEIFNIRTLMDLGGLAILYAYHLQRGELRMKHELDAINNILQNQYVQYQQSRESIDLIDRKYHDLKHQIAALRAEPDPARRSAWLDEMQSDIKSYEAQNKTGNQVLDTLLTGKSLYCQKHDIGLTCVADGTLLDFMDVMDICTVFGNALDNAIECEKAIPDREKRLIHVSVSRQKGFLLLRFENYCEGVLQFEDGLPVTTKKDRSYHGYGLKSIRQTAKKYGGTVTVRAERNWFELRVLLPLPEE